MTVHARYNPSSVSGNNIVGGSYASSAESCFIGTSGNKALAISRVGSSNASAVGATVLSTGTWYSLCGVFSGTTSRNIYLDGTSDGSNATSSTPSLSKTARIGYVGTLQSGQGSVAEFAIWSVALGAEDIAALVYMSPLKIRPDALTCYIPLLDSGTLDYMATAATVGGSLTKDNDHPRVIYPRQRLRIVPVGASGSIGSGAGSSTGTSTVSGTGASTSAQVAVSTGTSTASGVGASIAEGVGSAACTSTAAAVGADATPSTQILGGWSWPEEEYRRRDFRERPDLREKIERTLRKMRGELEEAPEEAKTDTARLAAAERAVDLVAPYLAVTRDGINWDAFLQGDLMVRLQSALIEYQRAVQEAEDEDDLLLLAAA